MGVYIKGMEMPKSCSDCFVSANRCGLWVGFKEKTKRRSPYCPLVEVSVPHGRLGDLDALKNYFLEKYVLFDRTLEDIDNAPTVLEAEGKDDG